MGVGTWVQPSFAAQESSAVKTNIENCIQVAERLAAAFAPHEQSTPNMTVRVDAGPLWVGEILTEIAAQNSAAITAPTTNPRIDRVVKDSVTGVISVVEGTEAASPDPPDIPTGKEPICQVALATDTTEITNDLITDERVPGGGSNEAIKVNGVYENLGANPATELKYGTWQAMELQHDPSVSLLCHFEGSSLYRVDDGPYTLGGTPVGGLVLATAQKKFGSKSLYNDGTGRLRFLPDYFNFGYSSFTLELWLYFTDRSVNRAIFGGNSASGFIVGITTTNNLHIHSTTGEQKYVSWNPSTSTWYHLVITRWGNDLKFIINGIQQGVNQDVSGLAYGSPADDYFNLGYSAVATFSPFAGYMDEVRVCRAAKFWDNFTSPTAPYPDTYKWLRVA